MAILNLTGFESALAYEFISTSGSPTLDTGTKRTGGKSLKIPTDSNSFCRIGTIGADGAHAQPNVSNFSIRLYVRLTAGTTTGSGLGTQVVTGFNGTSESLAQTIFELWAPASGAWRLLSGSGLGTVCTSTVSVANDTWFLIEIGCSTSAGTSTLSLSVNGETPVTGTASVAAPMVRLLLGRQNTNNGGIYNYFLDDFIFTDSSTLPGDGSVAAIYPTANGSTQQFTSGTNSSNHAEVDDFSAGGSFDTDTTYIKKSSGASQTALFDATAAATAGISGTIKAVRTLAVMREDAGGTSSSLRALIKSSSSESVSTGVNGSTTYTGYSRIAEVDPATSAAWTVSGLDAAEFGCRDTSTESAVRCSAIVTYVDYLAQSGITTGTSAETDTALALTKTKIETTGVSTETNAAETCAVVKKIAASTVTSSEAALALTLRTSAVYTQAATEANSGLTLAAVKLGVIAAAEETNLAQAAAAVKIASVVTTTETSASIALSAVRILSVGVATETDTALALQFPQDQETPVGRSDETDLALAQSVLRLVASGQSLETNSAQALAAVKIESTGVASESSLAEALSIVKIASMGISSEIASAETLSITRLFTAAVSTESNVAFGLSAVEIETVGVATEASEAFSLTFGSAIDVGTATETDAAFAESVLKIVAVSPSTETETAVPLSIARVISVPLVATETDAALAAAVLKIATLGICAESDTALAIDFAGGLEVGTSEETNVALALSFVRAVPVAHAGVAEASIAVQMAKVAAVGLSTSTSAAFSLVPTKSCAFGLALETDLAVAAVWDVGYGDISIVCAPLGSSSLTSGAGGVPNRSVEITCPPNGSNEVL